MKVKNETTPTELDVLISDATELEGKCLAYLTKRFSKENLETGDYLYPALRKISHARSILVSYTNLLKRIKEIDERTARYAKRPKEEKE